MTTNFIQEENEQSEKITFATLLHQAIDSKIQELRVCMPAIIESYDHKTQKISARPIFKRQVSAEESTDMPLISNIPVCFPRAGGAFISMPLQKGDNVLLLFTDRSMDAWLSVGGKIDPNDPRAHDISDAVALAGCYPFSDPASVGNATDIILKNPSNNSFTEIRIKNNGHIQVSNQTDELIKVLNDMLQIIREAKVSTGSNGMQPLIHRQFSTVASRLKTFLEK